MQRRSDRAQRESQRTLDVPRRSLRPGLLEADDVARRLAIGQHVHDFDSGPFHFVHQGVYARREIAVGDESRRRHDQAGRGREQTLVNAAGKFGHGGVAAVGSDRAEGVDHSRDCSEQAEERREKSERGEDAEESLELRHFQLSRFLHDLAQFRAWRIVADDGGMNDARDRPRCAGRFVQRFGEIAALNEIGKPLQEFADVDGGAMEIKEALGENRDRHDAADQDRPHEQPALLDVIDHGNFS